MWFEDHVTSQRCWGLCSPCHWPGIGSAVDQARRRHGRGEIWCYRR